MSPGTASSRCSGLILRQKFTLSFGALSNGLFIPKGSCGNRAEIIEGTIVILIDQGALSFGILTIRLDFLIQTFLKFSRPLIQRIQTQRLFQMNT